MNPAFDPWDERYGKPFFHYGVAPSLFVREYAHLLPEASSVADLGSGEGRNAVWLAMQGHRVWAIDGSRAGLEKTSRLAQEHGAEVYLVHSDLFLWMPAKPLDAVLASFVHVPPARRPDLFALLKDIVRPGGFVLGEWFRPAQRHLNLPSGGPPDVSFLPSREEIAHYFASPLVLEEANPFLEEGGGHYGQAAVLRLVWQSPLT